MLTDFLSFQNRHYRSTYGTEASTWLYNQAVSIASGYSAITVSRFTHSFNQPSIIVKYPGTSSNLSKSTIEYQNFAQDLFPPRKPQLTTYSQSSLVLTTILPLVPPLPALLVPMTMVPALSTYLRPSAFSSLLVSAPRTPSSSTSMLVRRVVFLAPRLSLPTTNLRASVSSVC